MKMIFKEIFHLRLIKVYQSRLVVLVVFDLRNICDIISNEYRIRIMDGLLDKIAGQASYKAQKAGNALALSIKMLGDCGVSIRKSRETSES